LIDDVMRKGFLHNIDVASDNSAIIISARVSSTPNSHADILPILRMRFTHAAFRQFIYAGWEQFVSANHRSQTMDDRETLSGGSRLVILDCQLFDAE